MMLHAGHLVLPANVLAAWTWEPVPVITAAVASFAYWRGAKRLASLRGWSPLRRARAMYFGMGILALLVALASPLDELAGSLFTAHMIQHELLVLVVAPFLVMSAPVADLLRGLSVPVRRVLVGGWQRARPLRTLIDALLHPAAALTLHVIALLAWHVGPLYERALWHPWWHALEHACFVFTAMLFWWGVLQPVGHRRLSVPLSIMSLFAITMATGALGAIIAFADVPWYAGQELSAASWGMTALEDQQVAGLIMWIPGGLVYVAVAARIAMRWLSASDGDRLVRQQVVQDVGRAVSHASLEKLAE